MFPLILIFMVFKQAATTTETISFSTDYKTGSVEAVDTSIVAESLMASKWSRCNHVCSTREEFDLMSVYYDPDTSECYCNDATDSNAVFVESGHRIRYTTVSKRYIVRKSSSGMIFYDIPNGLFRDCLDIYEQGYRQNFVYKIIQSGSYADKLNCENGWTVFQKRVDNSTNFYRTWQKYVDGFGDVDGDFWHGLANVRQMTKDRTCELRIEMEADSTHASPSGYAAYTNFQIGDSTSFYALSVSGYSGNVGDSLSSHNGHPFSTYNNDHDNSAGNCAGIFKGGWWYDDCHNSNLNGLYLNGTHETSGDGMNWKDGWGLQYSLSKTKMKFKCSLT